MQRVGARPHDHRRSDEAPPEPDSSSSEGRKVHQQRLQLKDVKSLFASETENFNQKCFRDVFGHQNPKGPGRHRYYLRENPFMHLGLRRILQSEGRGSTTQERDAIENSQSFPEKDRLEDDGSQEAKRRYGQEELRIANDRQVKAKSRE